MFGPGDALVGTLENLARLLPVLPLMGGGRTRLQPVYVEDVAEAIARMLAALKRTSASRCNDVSINSRPALVRSYSCGCDE
jgi:NADH dehydrogenase